ncbi:type 1 fimbrial protein [Providencia stuartii]|uniref:fimbrial protein n=1 Tax=Providencia stuartii TaxID=588 RepID=UPI00300C05F9
MAFKKVALTVALLAGISGVSLNANADAQATITLEGVITNTTCDVEVNGGQATLFVGVYKSSDFEVNKQLGSVPMPVSLTNCTGAETGKLVVQGLTATGDTQNQIFVDDVTNTVGFMIKDANGTQASNLDGPELEIADGETSAKYIFEVGMGSTTTSPTADAYSAPILVAYVTE